MQEDDNIAAFDLLVGNQRTQPAGPRRERHFVDERTVADQQRVFHRLRGNLESLRGERGEEERQNRGAHDGREVLPERGWRILLAHKVNPPSAFRENFTSIVGTDRKSTRLNSSHQIISYAVFCL